MNLYWYWPFAREEDIGLAPAILRPGDALTVEVINRPGAPLAAGGDQWRVVAGLPEVGGRRPWTPGWLADRASTYAQRATVRRKALRDGHYDLCHLLYLNYFTDAIDPTLRKRRCPVVASVHDVMPHRPRLPPPVLHRVLARQYHGADQLVVHHEWMRRELIERFAIRPERISVIAHFVSPPAAGPGADETGPPLVLFFGSFRENKGIPDLLDAIAHQGDATERRFHFAGRGSAPLERLVGEAAERDRRITADIGWVDPARKAELYRQAALVVLPYRAFSSQSGVLHESYGYGVPVVVTDVGALGQTVREDGTGWVVAPDRPAELAAAIDTALTDRSSYASSRDRARAVAEERHPDRVGAALRNLYDEVWRRGR